ncbi:hypothetical protein N8I77_004966 [Diaporthe amygdali]|uniref:Uncharacterized protein n=1 Tax=Phomopsis amygdali TaxID=1214568 RepID=A0AAD9W959_PHOAM|nr:uncharacterized protein J7T55_015462 [Diaporthe amygdali]KAJ0120730.1 hypothetical protein J7T55_015462 [Diaporthe amygdali]KAK2611636.1 hypothetical protein N8I77_004966 [Diaporthe amygdali]
MKVQISALVNLVALSLTGVANAACEGYALGVTEPHDLGGGMAQYKVYDSSCALSQDLTINSTIGHCDSQYFVCKPLTTEIYAYDDPVTGLAYNCVDNPETSETCEEEEISLCCSLGYPPDSDDPIYNR